MTTEIKLNKNIVKDKINKIPFSTSINAKKLNLFHKVIWTLGHIYPVKRFRIVHVQLYYTELIVKWTQSEDLQGIKRLKAIHDSLELSMVNPEKALYDAYDPGQELWLRRERVKQIIPKPMGFFHSLWRNNPTKKFVLSCLQMHKFFYSAPDTSVGSITGKYRGRCHTMEELLSCLYSQQRQQSFNVHDLVRSLKGVPCVELVRPKPDSKKLLWGKDPQWFLSEKAGPNGGPSFNRWYEDYVALRVKHPKLLASITRFARLTENQVVLNFLEHASQHESGYDFGPRYKVVEDVLTFKKEQIFKKAPHLREKWEKLPKKEKRSLLSKVPRRKKYQKYFIKSLEWDHRNRSYWKKFEHSRLHFIPEKSGKTRVVALADIYTQSVLKPIHDYFMDILRCISDDCTFDQSRGTERLKHKTQLNSWCFSMDLKSCTDRFPAWFQKEVVRSYLGDDIAEEWHYIMTQRYFVTKVGNKLKRFKYSVGQPMGLLSSWAVMAVSHHFVIRLASHHINMRCRGEYILLGDDICIFDIVLASRYRYILEDLLGVSISKQKTLIGKGYGTFTKVLVDQGVPISPVKPTLIKTMNEFPELSLQMIRDIEATKNTGLSRLDWIKHVRGPLKVKTALALLNPVNLDHKSPLLEAFWGFTSGEARALEMIWDYSDNFVSNSKLEKDEALLYHFLSHRHNTERDLVLWSLGPEKEWFVRKSADMGDWYNGSIYVGDGFVMYEPMMRGESSLGLGLHPINIPKFLRVDRRFIPPFLIKTEPEHKETLEISQNKLNFIIHLSELFSVRWNLDEQRRLDLFWGARVPRRVLSKIEFLIKYLAKRSGSPLDRMIRF